MAAKQGDKVSVHYTGKFKDGTVFDKSGGQALEFKIGQGQVIKGFEEAVVGMKPGESKTADIAVDQAYGLHHQEMVRMVERNQFPSEFEPEVGKRFQFRQADGRTLVATVKEVSESHITLDANHPLAGKDLVFEIELVGIGNDGDT